MQLPLFPLHAVLFPGIVLPLHIFEERYRALVRHCVSTGEPFGIVLIQAGREVGPSATLALARVGTIAEIREAGRYIDGRYDLLVAGTGRFALDSVDSTAEPYLVGEVAPLEDEVGVEDTAERLSAAAIRRFVRYLSLVRARDGETEQVLDVRVEVDAPEVATAPDEPPEPAEVDLVIDDIADAAPADPPMGSSLRIPDDPTTLSYLLAGIVAIEDPRRQALLEAASTVERLTALVELLDREIVLLGHRLRLFTPDPAFAAVRRA